MRWSPMGGRPQRSGAAQPVMELVELHQSVIVDGVLTHVPARYVQRHVVVQEPRTFGLTHSQFETYLAAARASSNPNDLALVIMLGVLGLRLVEATALDVDDLLTKQGQQALRVVGKGTQIPLTPAAARAIERAVDRRTSGPILVNAWGRRMGPVAATRRLRRLAGGAGVRPWQRNPHLLRHPLVATLLDADVARRGIRGTNMWGRREPGP